MGILRGTSLASYLLVNTGVKTRRGLFVPLRSLGIEFALPANIARQLPKANLTQAGSCQRPMG